MATLREQRRIGPLEEHIQAELRRLIRRYQHAEVAARALGLPPSTFLSGAAGAPMLATTRKRIVGALERQRCLARQVPAGQRAPHLQLVQRERALSPGCQAALAACIRQRGLPNVASELDVGASDLLSASIGQTVPEHLARQLERAAQSQQSGHRSDQQ